MLRRSSSTEGEKPLSSFSFRARSSTDLDASPSKSALRGPPAPPSAVSGSWIRHQIRPFSALVTCPKLGSSPSRRMVVCFWTAAFRILARTTSSVTRALNASRSREPVAHGRVRDPGGNRQHFSRGTSPAPRRCSGCGRRRPDPAGTPDTAWTASNVHRTLGAVRSDERVRVLARRAGSATLTSKPSATSISHDLAAAP